MAHRFGAGYAAVRKPIQPRSGARMQPHGASRERRKKTGLCGNLDLNPASSPSLLGIQPVVFLS